MTYLDTAQKYAIPVVGGTCFLLKNTYFVLIVWSNTLVTASSVGKYGKKTCCYCVGFRQVRKKKYQVRRKQESCFFLVMRAQVCWLRVRPFWGAAPAGLDYWTVLVEDKRTSRRSLSDRSNFERKNLAKKWTDWLKKWRKKPPSQFTAASSFFKVFFLFFGRWRK